MKYNSEEIKQFAIAILQKAGMNAHDAGICADCLITANLRAVHSHGITHLKDIVSRIAHGTIQPRAAVEIEQTAPSTIRVNGNQCAGMVSGMAAMERCVELARSTGVSVATIFNANTYGLGAYYPLYAASKGMIGFAVCNTKAYVAPWGGVEPLLGTNPISIAIPAGKRPDLVIDMATSQSAVNKIVLAMKEGRQIPADWAVDSDGSRTTDPAKAYQGALLPFGGYKGYAIQLFISVLAFALAGGDMDKDIPRAWVDEEKPCNFGCVMGAIDVSKFLSPEVFRSRVDTFLDEVKGSRAAKGFEAVRIPGEQAYASMQKALEEGIEISDIVVSELLELGKRYGEAFPSPV